MKKRTFFAQNNRNQSDHGTYLGTWLIPLTTIYIILVYILYRQDTHILLFGNGDTALGQYVNMSGTFLGGLMLIYGLWLNSKRLAEGVKQSVIAKNTQLDRRFKDAADLLANSNSSAILTGIYTLHQIAVETHRSNELEKSDVKIVHQILCAYIRESTNEVKDGKNGKVIVLNDKKPIVIQTILKVLFSNENDIYGHLVTDLSNCVLSGINLEEARFVNVDFSGTLFLNCTFKSSKFYSCYFMNNGFGNVDFSGCSIRNTLIRKAKMNFVSFKECIIDNSIFANSLLFKVSMRDVKRSNLQFEGNITGERPFIL